MLTWPRYYRGWFSKCDSREDRCLLGPPLIIYHASSGRIIFSVRLRFPLLLYILGRCLCWSQYGKRHFPLWKLHVGCHAEVTFSWAWGQIHPLPTSLTCLNAFKLPVRQTSCCFEKRGAMHRGQRQCSKGITCHGDGPRHSWLQAICPELLLLLQPR